MIGDLNRLLATEQFSSLGFQIINEASLMDDSPCPEPEQTNVSLSVLKRTAELDGLDRIFAVLALDRPASDKVPVHKLSHLEHRDNLLAVEYRQ